jgi:16S rRNA processing protein RimM
MSSPATEGIAVVGRVQGAFGVKGWVRIQSYTEPPENLLAYGPWLLASSGRWEPCAHHGARAHGDGFVAALEGVADRDAAQALRGTLIAVPEEALPPPATDEFYWRDLAGLAVCDEGGAVLGRVKELMATGANDVLVITLRSGKEALVAFDRRYVLEVDLAAGRIVVDWEFE